MLRPIPRVLVAAAALSLVAACSDDEDDPGGTNLNLTASCSSSPSGSGPRVYLECFTVSQNLVTVDLWGEDIPDEIDAYNIVFSFSPSAFRYAGFVGTATVYSPNNCGGGAVLCLDNLSTNANTDGEVVYGVSLIGLNPTGAVIGSGTRARLGQLMFEAAAASNTSLLFSNVSNAGCVGDASTGNALLTFTGSDSCVSSVIAGVTFRTDPVTLSATSP